MRSKILKKGPIYKIKFLITVLIKSINFLAKPTGTINKDGNQVKLPKFRYN